MKNQINVIDLGLIFLLPSLFIFLIHSETQRNVMKREINSLKSSNEILVDQAWCLNNLSSQE